MFGVVLWGCQQAQKAVIWCDDHGDLAFLDAEDVPSHETLGLTPGDLVRFDLQIDSQMRKAVNPRVIAEDQYPSLASTLEAVGREAQAMSAPKETRNQVAAEAPVTPSCVIPFRVTGPFQPANTPTQERPCLVSTSA